MPKYTPITAESSAEIKENLAMELIKWLVKRDLFYDVFIYVNGKRYASNVYKPKLETKEITNTDICPEPFFVQDNINAKDYIEYANPDLITMSFEGPLYHEINYGNGKTYEDLRKFFNKYNLYFELGYAWSLSLYEN